MFTKSFAVVVVVVVVVVVACCCLLLLPLLLLRAITVISDLFNRNAKVIVSKVARHPNTAPTTIPLNAHSSLKLLHKKFLN